MTLSRKEFVKGNIKGKRFSKIILVFWFFINKHYNHCISTDKACFSLSQKGWKLNKYTHTKQDDDLSFCQSKNVFMSYIHLSLVRWYIVEKVNALELLCFKNLKFSSVPLLLTCSDLVIPSTWMQSQWGLHFCMTSSTSLHSWWSQDKFSSHSLLVANYESKPLGNDTGIQWACAV